MTVRLVEVKLVDDRGRTLCVLAWDAGGEITDNVVIPGKEPSPPAFIEPQWRVRWKPQSAKSRRHSEGQLAEDNISMIPGHAITKLPTVLHEGRRYLAVPGLYVRWEKVTAALDALAANTSGQESLTLTVDQFRRCL